MITIQAMEGEFNNKVKKTQMKLEMKNLDTKQKLQLTK